ncbi:MAG: hypothetical protein M1833_001078 [Piccolia ochrophora]|nr:MAG: hypothetical protein M1833_001078 [Piccolia ochrophora]
MSGTTNLPQRQATTSSDSAVPDEDPSGAAGLLVERLQAWKHLCGYLENYITATEKIQKAHSKEYEKVLKSISEPLKEGQHFDQSLGGMAGLFENMRSNTQAMSNLHLETEKNLKGSVLPILERLHAEIKNKNKELTGGAAKGSKAVDKARNTTQAHIELLGQHTASFDASGHKIDPSTDPYVIQRGIYHRLNKQILEENNNRQDLLSVQDSFGKFEEHVLQTIQQALAAFVQLVGGQADRTKAMYRDILSNAQRVPLNFEWTGFIHRNSEVLIDRSAPPRTMDNVNFPNQNHRSTQPLIEGSLERKSRMMGKGYSTGYYVVTPSKFLHEYKDTDSYRKDPTPELSLYLPDCTVGAVAGPKFTVKGKNTSKGTIGNKLATSHELDFKAHSPQDAEKWHSVVRAAAGSTTNDLPSASEPNSPVNQRDASGSSQPPAYEAQHQQQPSVQTQGLTGAKPPPAAISGGQTVASPTSAGGVGQTPVSAGGAPTSAGALPPQGGAVARSGVEGATGKY